SYKIKEKVNNSSYISSIYCNHENIVIVFSDKVEIINKTNAEARVLPFKEFQYSNAGIWENKLFLYGAYNYHILDGYPILQITKVDLTTLSFESQKRHIFSG